MRPLTGEATRRYSLGPFLSFCIESSAKVSDYITRTYWLFPKHNVQAGLIVHAKLNISQDLVTDIGRQIDFHEVIDIAIGLGSGLVILRCTGQRKASFGNGN